MESVYRPLEGDEVRFVRIQPGAWTDPIQCDLLYLPLPNTEVDLVEAWFSGKPLPRLLDQELYDPRSLGRSSPAEEEDQDKDSAAAAPTPMISPFIALSYAWGDLNHTEELLLDGQPVQRTVNLIAGLRRLRALLENSSAPDIFLESGILFWIDALCINQADETEKSAQVPRMGAIYGAAEVVLAWLGENEADGGIQELMRLVREMHTYYESGSEDDDELESEDDDELESEDDDESGSEDDDELESEDDDELESEDDDESESEGHDELESRISLFSDVELLDIFHASMEISRRAWYERVWVVQEIVRAQHVVLLAGAHACPFERFPVTCASISEMVQERQLADLDRTALARQGSYFYIRNRVRDNIRNIFQWHDTNPDGSLILTQDADVSSLSTQDAEKKESVWSLSPEREEYIPDSWTDVSQEPNRSPMDAKEALRTRIFAVILEAAISNMISTFKATIPHDYIYGVLSIGGNLRCPDALVPDYTLPFAEIFHTYSMAILKHTSALTIIPRITNKLEGVPSWVPDFRSPRPFLFSILNHKHGKINIMEDSLKVNIMEEGRVLVAPGLHLGEVVLVHGRYYDTACELQFHDIIDGFDKFIEGACVKLSLDKEDVLSQIFKALSEQLIVGCMTTSQIEQIYDDCLYHSSLVHSQSRTLFSDTKVILSREIAELSWTVTSQGIISALVRDDDRPQTGDVVALMNGDVCPWLLRPAIASGQEEFVVVGACREFVQQLGEYDHYYDTHREVREFRLV